MKPTSRTSLCMMYVMAASAVLCARRVAANPADYFAIHIIDEQTGRGVPLVEVETTDHVRQVTDSAGFVAFNDPGLMNQTVFFTITSHGYEFPADGFGFHGKALATMPGTTATLAIKRINIAERLYRITGEGIYADSSLLGKKAPIERPLLNSEVVGQDSVLAEVYNGKIHWFWGDTSRAAYPLGNFSTTGAISQLPDKGGLAPSVGVNIDYFSDGKGFVKKVVPLPDPGPVWIDGLIVLKGESGKDRMLAHFSRMKDLGTRLERGLIVWNDKAEQFDKLKPVPIDAPLSPGGHPFRATDGGVEYFYFPVPYPSVRVRATWKDFTDLSAYEAYTCLAEEARYEKAAPKLDLDPGGHAKFSWKKDTPQLDSKQLKELIDSGKLKREDCPFRLEDADTAKPLLLHGGSVYWNDYRKRFIMIGLEGWGTSVLGEIWYAEAKTPLGPWVKAKKIVTHNKMDFYNPTQHPFFDEQGGRTVYFEGTYTNSFSGNPCRTPKYEYNQIMYMLDLGDERLRAAHSD